MCPINASNQIFACSVHHLRQSKIAIEMRTADSRGTMKDLRGEIPIQILRVPFIENSP
jgi:hypothetical protein